MGEWVRGWLGAAAAAVAAAAAEEAVSELGSGAGSRNRERTRAVMVLLLILMIWTRPRLTFLLFDFMLFTLRTLLNGAALITNNILIYSSLYL